MDIIIPTLFILVPAGVANMMASLSRYIFPKWTTPINSRWFGDHKTWRGLIIGILAGTCAGLSLGFIALMLQFGAGVSFDDRLLFFPFLFAVSFSALLGDLIKSFFKRRVGIAPGKPWIPFDQLDWIVGAFIAYSIYTKIFVWQTLLAMLIMGGLLHMMVNVLARFLSLQKNWL